MFNLKKCILLIVIICNIAVLASCGQKVQDPDVDATQQEYSQPGTNDRRGSGEWNQSSPDVYGEVKEISGNKLTLALLEIPQRRQISEEEMKKRRENFGDMRKQGAKKDYQDTDSGNNDNFRRNGNGAQRSGSIGMKKYTGDTISIEAPESVSITTFERGNNNFEEKQLKFKDIKIGSIIQVWYKKDSGDKKEIDRIRLMSMENRGFGGKPPADLPQDASKSKPD